MLVYFPFDLRRLNPTYDLLLVSCRPQSSDSTGNGSSSSKVARLVVALVVDRLVLQLLRGLRALRDHLDLLALLQPRVVVGLVDGLLALQQLRTGRPER